VPDGGFRSLETHFLIDLVRCRGGFDGVEGPPPSIVGSHVFVPDGGFRSLETHYFTGVTDSTALTEHLTEHRPPLLSKFPLFNSSLILLCIRKS